MNTKNKKNALDSNSNKTGSPEKGEPVFLAIGKLRRAHALSGEILMDVTTHFPERIVTGKVLFIGKTHKTLTIEKLRWANKNILIKFIEVNTPEEVAAYRNHLVYVLNEQLPSLPEGEYYHHQILGLRVVDEAGEDIGVLEDIIETGANDVYVVKSKSGQEILLPVIFDVILTYQLDEGKIIVRLPEMF